MWVNMGLAYEKLPEHVKTQIAGLRARHSIEATFGAAMPLEKRLALKAQFPDAEHPVVRTHPETGEKILFVNAFTTHFTNFHTPDNVRFGQDYAPAAANLLSYLISQAFIPGVPGSLPLAQEQRRFLGQPLHSALRGDGLPAMSSQDGARWNRRRPSVLIYRELFELLSARTDNEFPRWIALPREPGKTRDHRRTVRARVDAIGLSRGHPGDDRRAGAEGGGLLQRRRHGAARARSRTRRQGLQAPVQVQRAARAPSRRRARHGPAGGRFDLLRARNRRCRRQVAVRRHASHARRARLPSPTR